MDNPVMAVIVGRLIAGTVAFAAAGFVAYKGNDGWGWLVFAGIICCWITAERTTTRTIEDSEDEK